MVKEKLEEILSKMEDIKYGFVDGTDNIYPDDDKDWDKSFGEKYKLQSPADLIKNKYGVCWDQVELERFYLDQEKIDFSVYFIVNYDNLIYPTHTFVIVNSENISYWLEHSWAPNRGIHEYKNEKEALESVKEKFETMLKNKYNIENDNTYIFKYDKPKYGITCNEFYKHCESGIEIEI